MHRTSVCTARGVSFACAQRQAPRCSCGAEEPLTSCNAHGKASSSRRNGGGVHASCKVGSGRRRRGGERRRVGEL